MVDILWTVLLTTIEMVEKSNSRLDGEVTLVNSPTSSRRSNFHCQAKLAAAPYLALEANPQNSTSTVVKKHAAATEANTHHNENRDLPQKM
jgi:hypothetical protein